MILIVDDDQSLTNLLSDYLETEGFVCRASYDGPSGLATLKSDRFDLVILDVMLPGLNGFEVLAELRQKHNAVPVIMLTAKGEAVDMIVGLEMGADDYLAKPFNPRELLARIRAVLRRFSTSSTTPDSLLTLDGFELNEKSYEARHNSQTLPLTPLEFKIFNLLLRSAGEVVPRAELYKKALGKVEHAFDRSLDMHISRLRKKVELASGYDEAIKSIRNEGYIYVPLPKR